MELLSFFKWSTVSNNLHFVLLWSKKFELSIKNLSYLRFLNLKQVSVLEKVTGDYKEDKKNTVFYTIEVVSDDKEKRAGLDIKDLFFTFKSYTTHGDDKGLSFTKVTSSNVFPFFMSPTSSKKVHLLNVTSVLQ